ncbi:MAG: hypothetical protein WCW31_04230 [Patescibacteria group bacterium]|jgi:hypothetical protein
MNMEWPLPKDAPKSEPTDAKPKIQEKVHLREDIQPIKGRISDYAQDNEELEDIREQMSEESEDEGVIHWVDYEGGDIRKLKEDGFKLAGMHTFLISPIDERDWFSDRYSNCTGVVGIGRDAQTGKEISFLSHQDPNYFVDGGEEKAKIFAGELSGSLKELRERSQEGTVEVLLLGGNYHPTTPPRGYKHEQYKKSIERLRRIVQEALGFDPKVLVGPNNTGSDTTITVETQKRKVWIERSKQSEAFNEPYQANEFDEAEKTWLKSSG